MTLADKQEHFRRNKDDLDGMIEKIPKREDKLKDDLDGETVTLSMNYQRRPLRCISLWLLKSLSQYR